MCATFGGKSAFVFQAKQLVLTKQEANSWRKLRECFRELLLSVNMSLPFCVFCWFLFCCNISNKQIVPPAAGHEGMIIWGTHRWIEQWACQVVESPCFSWRSVCYNLKSRHHYLIEGEKKTELNWLLAGCRCKMEWQGTCGFLPMLMQSYAIPGNYKLKNMSIVIRRNWLLHWKLRYLLLLPVPWILKVIFKSAPLYLSQPLDLSSALKCIMLDIAVLCYLINDRFIFFCLITMRLFIF